MSGDSTADPEFDALRSIGHGAIVSIGAISAQKLLFFLMNLVLTHGLPVNLYGTYALGRRITQMALRLGSFGGTQSLVRFLPQYAEEEARQRQVVGLTYVTAFVVSVALAGGLFVFADQLNALTIASPAFPRVLRIFALLLPFNVLIRVLSFLFRALEMVEYQVFVRRLATPGARLVAVSVALLLGFSVFGVVWAVAIATVAVAVLSVWLSITETTLRPALRLPHRRGETAEFYNYAVPNAVSQVGRIFRGRIDVFLIGFLLTAGVTGIYNLTVVLTSVIAIPLVAFNQLLPPIASDLYSNGETETLARVYSTITRLIFTGTVVIAGIEFVYRAELLAVFGASYTQGTVILAVFVVGRVIGSAVGATGWLLLMTDHQYLRMANSWGLGVLNVGLSYAFVVEFGAVGAALGTAGSLAVINVVRLGQLWYLEGLQPFTRRFFKPAVAGIGMMLAMALCQLVLSGTVVLLVGTGVGVVVFGGLLVLFGLEQRDKRLFRSL